MKSRFSILALLAASMLIGAGGASAHTKGGSLGKKPGATDIYQVTCYDDGAGVGAPARLDVQVQDLVPVKPPLITAQVQKGAVNVSTTDPKDGDKKASPLVSAPGGAGTYTVTVSKTAKPGKPDKVRAYPEIYRLTFHCMSGSGQHAGTDIETTQNQ
jgi:hypothetical protein